MERPRVPLHSHFPPCSLPPLVFTKLPATGLCTCCSLSLGCYSLSSSLAPPDHPSLCEPPASPLFWPLVAAHLLALGTVLSVWCPSPVGSKRARVILFLVTSVSPGAGTVFNSWSGNYARNQWTTLLTTGKPGRGEGAASWLQVLGRPSPIT